MEDVLKFLDVAIGLVFIYAILSLIVTSLVELLHQCTTSRAKILAQTIERLLGPDLTKAFYRHPRIQALMQDDDKKPSYVEPQTFAICAIEVAINADTLPAEDPKSDGAQAKMALKLAVQFSDLERCPIELSLAIKRCQQLWPEVVRAEFAACHGNLAKLQNGMFSLFRETSDRASGWFIKINAKYAWLVGAVVALLANADSVLIVNRLSTDDKLREQVVAKALERSDTTQSTDTTRTNTEVSLSSTVSNAVEVIKRNGLEVEPMLGWSRSDYFLSKYKGICNLDWPSLFALLSKLLGLGMTTVALSLGAPFWFDLLSKLVRMRRSIKPKALEEDYLESTPGVSSADPAGGPSPANPAGSGGVVTAVPGASDPDAYQWGLKGFRPFSAEYAVANHYWLSVASALAYEDDADKIRAVFQPRGFQTSKMFSAGTVSHTQFFLAVDQNTLIVTFRGTEKTLKDWLTDAKANLEPRPTWDGVATDARFHYGFASALDEAWDVLKREIDARMTSNLNIWFTGHSLGAALAVLAAYRYQLWQNDLTPQDRAKRTTGRVMGVYTIGQPRVGNGPAAKHIEEVLEKRIYRGINNRDIVPRVPPRGTGYVESGSVYYFDQAGRFLKDPGLWYRILDTVVVTPDDYKNKAAESIRDHRSLLYVSLFHQACLSVGIDVGKLEDLGNLG